jgi:hypothetical protein
VTACGICQRSRTVENIIAYLNFCSFYFRIRDGAYKIYEFPDIW